MATKTTTSPQAEPSPLKAAIMNLEAALNELRWILPNELSTAERRRLNGAGTRRYGFIDKVMDYAEEFPQFAPSMFDIREFLANKHEIEQFREAQILSEMIDRAIRDSLLLRGETLYGKSLMYYNSLRELAKRNVPGARELFDHLRSMFARRRRPDSPETEHELLRDARKLIEGKADGKILIENERPAVSGGKHEVIDEMHRDKIAFRESEEEIIDN